MTYNFDPDRWYEREWSALKRLFKTGAISREDFDEACEKLERRYDAMIARLDGTYRIP